MSNMKTLDLLRQQEGFSFEALRAMLEGMDARLVILVMVAFLAACGGEGKKDKKGETKAEREAAEYCMSIEKWLTDRSSNFDILKPSTVSAEVVSSARDLNTACQNMKLGDKKKAVRDIVLAANSNSLKVCFNNNEECNIYKAIDDFSQNILKGSITRECFQFFNSVPDVDKNTMQKEIDAAYKICSVTHFKANKHSWKDLPFR